ncbi:DNA packaging protein [Celeribacter halophilus]|uniref:DNA packaging protein n=1 Tax=Celeribacter halophilus TaxID=576117 RepID=UPI003A8FF8D6
MRIVQELPLEGDAPVHRIDGAGLCALLGVTPAVLTDLKRKGIAVHCGRDAWDLTATVSGYCAHLRGTASGRGGEEHVNTLTAERARLAKEQADAQALKNARARGELIEADAVTREWADVLRGVRARVLAVSSKVRQRLGHLTSEDVAEIDAILREALTEAAQEGAEHGTD